MEAVAQRAAGEDVAAPARGRTIGYWALTLIVAWEMVAGSMWDLLRIEFVRGVMTHLGYPLYVLFIIGVWKLPCAVTLLVPRFLRLKEWAYAGIVFDLSGAAMSHAIQGRTSDLVAPLALLGLGLLSWALRPESRTLGILLPSTTEKTVTLPNRNPSFPK